MSRSYIERNLDLQAETSPASDRKSSDANPLREARPSARGYRLMTLWTSITSGGPASSTPAAVRIGIRR